MEKSDLIRTIETHKIESERLFYRLLSGEDKTLFLNIEEMPIDGELSDIQAKAWEEAESSESFTLIASDKSTDENIGYIMLKKLNSCPEIGVTVKAEFRGAGLGYEMCRTIIDYCFAYTNAEKLDYHCFRNNKKSSHLAEKLGAVLVEEHPFMSFFKSGELSAEDQTEVSGFDLLVYEILK